MLAPTITPRDYQQQAVDAVCAMLEDNISHPVIVSPCGSGKSLMIAMLIERLKTHQILVITPRKKLLLQNASTLMSFNDDMEFGICSASFDNDLGDQHSVVLGTYQTLLQRKNTLVKPTLIILDEAHLLPEDGCLTDLIHYFGVPVIGLTASPLRKNKSIFALNLNWQLAIEVQTMALIRQGYLVPVRALNTASEQSNNDWLISDIQWVTESAMRDAVVKIEKEQRLRPIVYARDIAHARFIHHWLLEHGQASLIVHSHRSDQAIEAALSQFSETPDTCVFLVNVNIVNIGIDLPCADTVILLRHVNAFGTYLQIIGRVMRVFRNKRDGLVLDYGHNITKFGIINPVFSDLTCNEQNGHSIGFKTCAQCETLNPLNAQICYHCQGTFKLKLNLSDIAANGRLLSTTIGIGKVIQLTSREEPAGIVETSFQLDNGITVKAFSAQPYGNNVIGQYCTYEKSPPINPLIKLG